MSVLSRSAVGTGRGHLCSSEASQPWCSESCRKTAGLQLESKLRGFPQRCDWEANGSNSLLAGAQVRAPVRRPCHVTALKRDATVSTSAYYEGDGAIGKTMVSRPGVSYRLLDVADQTACSLPAFTTTLRRSSRGCARACRAFIGACSSAGKRRCFLTQSLENGYASSAKAVTCEEPVLVSLRSGGGTSAYRGSLPYRK